MLINFSCMKIITDCLSNLGKGRRKRDLTATQEQMGSILAHRALAIQVHYDLAEQFLGDEKW